MHKHHHSGTRNGRDGCRDTAASGLPTLPRVRVRRHARRGRSQPPKGRSQPLAGRIGAKEWTLTRCDAGPSSDSPLFVYNIMLLPHSGKILCYVMLSFIVSPGEFSSFHVAHRFRFLGHLPLGSYRSIFVIAFFCLYYYFEWNPL